MHFRTGIAHGKCAKTRSHHEDIADASHRARDENPLWLATGSDPPVGRDKPSPLRWKDLLIGGVPVHLSKEFVAAITEAA